MNEYEKGLNKKYNYIYFNSFHAFGCNVGVIMRKFHCFFEQSGTFKNEFKKLGYEAYDYDILNDFGETDYVIDLFNEIEKAYDNKNSVFDDISKDDMILAFFPCVRFEDQILLYFRGENYAQKNWELNKKLEYDLQLHNELHNLYTLITKLAIICDNRKIPLMIENPYSEQHYLSRYWCIKPKIIDKDRTKNGDYYGKPTQYFFVNFEPKNNFIFEPIILVKKEIIAKTKKVGNLSQQKMRSMIHPQYANRFIRTYILEEEKDEKN